MTDTVRLTLEGSATMDTARLAGIVLAGILAPQIALADDLKWCVKEIPVSIDVGYGMQPPSNNIYTYPDAAAQVLVMVEYIHRSGDNAPAFNLQLGSTNYFTGGDIHNGQGDPRVKPITGVPQTQFWTPYKLYPWDVIWYQVANQSHFEFALRIMEQRPSCDNH